MAVHHVCVCVDVVGWLLVSKRCVLCLPPLSLITENHKHNSTRFTCYMIYYVS